MFDNRKGFTLIELLVVIAIIAILAAILFPVFASARKSAHVANCASNMKQWGAGMLLYVDDNNGKFPWGGASGYKDDYHAYKFFGGAAPSPNSTGGLVIDSLHKYVKNSEKIRWCPLWKASIYRGYSSYYKWSYWYYCPHNSSTRWNPDRTTNIDTPSANNEYVYRQPNSWLCGYSTADVSAPGKKPFLCEFNVLHDPEGLSNINNSKRSYSMNIVYCDGHVKLIRGMHSEISAKIYIGRDGR